MSIPGLNLIDLMPITLNCRGRIVDLQKPRIMGILNLTPDSFYDGGRYLSESTVLHQAEKMLLEGTTWIDIGGVSTRPGAQAIGEVDEMRRVLPFVETITRHFPDALLSIDTSRANVARAAVQAGACLINDVSGGADEAMFETVANLKVPYILMHTQGTPQTMQQNPQYNDVVYEVTEFLAQKIGLLRKTGVHDIIADVGFGFGKTVQHNHTLLHNMDTIGRVIAVPLLAGLSRKSMVYKPLNCSPADALNGTSVLNTVALLKGAKILRVHDVKAAQEVIQLCFFEKVFEASRKFT